MMAYVVGYRRVLALRFRAGGMVLFIPWGVGAERRAGSSKTRSGRLGPTPQLRFSGIRFGATLELGRSERTTMRPLWSYGVDGADSPDRKPRCR